MALLSALLSFIGKKIGSILQAIFGWSVTALFGRLPQKKQLAVTVALLLSIAWPFFVLGLFLPGVSGWALAVLPLEQWFGRTAMRIVWAALALLAPPIAGVLTHWAAPAKKTSAGGALVHGYPLAIGYFAAFIVTVVTVPIVKIAAILKGWTDAHVYVQPRQGRYDDVVRELCEACARAGLLPTVEDPPVHMVLATTVLKKLAKHMVSPIVAEQLKVVRAKEVELYLYPSDLLVRGVERHVANVRAMLMRTELDADAYLVGSERAQAMQDELERLAAVLRVHEAGGETVSKTATTRLVEIWKEVNTSNLAFDEWVLLEGVARRLERKITERHAGMGVLPLDREEDGLARVAAEANTTRETQMSIDHPPPERLPLEEASTRDLVREAVDEARELVRLEIAIARQDAKNEIKQATRAAIAIGIALAAGVLVLSLIGVAIVIALGGTVIAALIVAGVSLVFGAGAAYAGWVMLPKKPLKEAAAHMKGDVNQLKEHFA